MPNNDKTGPRGMGPGTGRGMGVCGGRYSSNLGQGRGYGRVMCGWFYNKYQSLPKEEKKELLKSEIEDLKQEMEMAEKELKQL
jgi:hypothetical protein